MLRSGLHHVRGARGTGWFGLRPPLIGDGAGTLVALPDIDGSIGVVPALLGNADGASLTVQLEGRRLGTRDGKGGEDLPEAVIAEVEMDENLVGRLDLDDLALATGMSTGRRGMVIPPNASTRLTGP